MQIFSPAGRPFPLPRRRIGTGSAPGSFAIGNCISADRARETPGSAEPAPLVIPAKAGIHGRTRPDRRPPSDRRRGPHRHSRESGNPLAAPTSSRRPPSDRRGPHRHSRESGNPWPHPPRPTAPLGPPSQPPRPHGSGSGIPIWIPAFAGMTNWWRIRLEPAASLGPPPPPLLVIPAKAGIHGGVRCATNVRISCLTMGSGCTILFHVAEQERTHCPHDRPPVPSRRAQAPAFCNRRLRNRSRAVPRLRRPHRNGQAPPTGFRPRIRPVFRLFSPCI